MNWSEFPDSPVVRTPHSLCRGLGFNLWSGNWNPTSSAWCGQKKKKLVRMQGKVTLKWCLLCCAKSLQSCLTLCDPMDSSLPGSSVYGILQGRILEWVAMPSSRGSSWPRNQTCVSCIGRWVLSQLCHLGSPYMLIYTDKYISIYISIGINTYL